MKLGAKLHIARDDINMVKELVKDFDFIEIYYTKHHLENSNIKKLSDSWIVHCPHHEDSINLALNKGVNHVKDSILFAQSIGAKLAIVHPGFLDSDHKKDFFLNESIEIIRKLRIFAKKHDIKLLVENLPLRSIANTELGSTPEEIEMILEGTGCGFVLDFAHAHHASVSHKQNYKKFIKGFYKLGPTMFHLYDGHSDSEIDNHLPLGKGDLDIAFFIKFIKKEPVTLELPTKMEYYIDALKYLKRFKK
jgi:sugar phosphate isomerase/epimerase